MSRPRCPVCKSVLPLNGRECDTCLVKRTFGARHVCTECKQPNSFTPGGTCQPSCKGFVLTEAEVNHRLLVRALDEIARLRKTHS